jgi:hypothetical protein
MPHSQLCYASTPIHLRHHPQLIAPYPRLNYASLQQSHTSPPNQLRLIPNLATPPTDQCLTPNSATPHPNKATPHLIYLAPHTLSPGLLRSIPRSYASCPLTVVKDVYFSISLCCQSGAMEQEVWIDKLKSWARVKIRILKSFFTFVFTFNKFTHKSFLLCIFSWICHISSEFNFSRVNFWHLQLLGRYKELPGRRKLNYKKHSS